jgi:hypothetical protein
MPTDIMHSCAIKQQCDPLPLIPLNRRVEFALIYSSINDHNLRGYDILNWIIRPFVGLTLEY